MEVFVLLPCFNESGHIRPLVLRIHQALEPLRDSSTKELDKIDEYHVLAVDDGSTDGTGEILEEMALLYPIRVFHHDFNMGLAEAYRTLVANVASLCADDDVVVIMDADETHDPSDIPSLLASVKLGADVAVASRYAGASQMGVPLHRRLLSRTANWIIRNLACIPIKDCTCGFRAFRGAVLKSLPMLESDGFEVSAELLIYIYRHNPVPVIEEVPFVLHYDRKDSKSKIKLWQTVKAYRRLLWKHTRINLTPLVRRVAYFINNWLGEVYDRDPTFWNDGIVAFVFVLFFFFVYDKLTLGLHWLLRLVSWVAIGFLSWFIQHTLRRFWVFQRLHCSSQRSS